MALVLKESIQLTTPHGASQVQLLFGDITKLPLDETVDIVFVSAFPGMYGAVPHTLIGALKRNLDVSVEKLARDKELNLLRNFNCWVSKPLAENVPFRRLVCYERVDRKGKLADQISGIFRAMMPLFNNQDTSVITPLLATGSQGHTSEDALKCIVSAACHWIKAGLPLRCLKIVVYVRNPHAASDADMKLHDQFCQYKRKWETKEKKTSPYKKKFDVCLSYMGEDKGLVSQVCRALLAANSKIVIYKEELSYDHTRVWQEQIFDIMVQSRKIVAILTPGYVDSAECLEQFNLALCCNRLTGAEVLAPFYLQTVDAFPSYMTLIQYTECRVRKEGEVMEDKLFSACTMLVSDLDSPGLMEEEGGLPSAEKSGESGEGRVKGGNPAEPDRHAYDVFISYAHRSPMEANELYETLQDIDPNLKIFFDKSELKTGNIWQETLYESVENAKVVVAFISKDYLQSTVCREEYNISLARYLSQDGIHLISMVVDDSIDELPPLLASSPVVDFRSPADKGDEDFEKLATLLISWVKRPDQHNQFSKPKEKISIPDLLAESRKQDFTQQFECDMNGVISVQSQARSDDPGETPASESPKVVVFSFSQDCLQQACVLSKFLKAKSSVKVKVEFLTLQGQSGAQPPQLQLLDSADMVVVVVSDEFMESSQHRSELHIALCRQRMTKDRAVVYLVQAHHSKGKPVYSHLLPHRVNLGDKHWFAQARRAGKLNATQSYMVQVPGQEAMEMRVTCSGLESGALVTAALDIAQRLTAGDSPGNRDIPTNIVNVAKLVCPSDVKAGPLKERCLSFAALTKEVRVKPGQGRRWKENNGLYEASVKQAKALRELQEWHEMEDGLQQSKKPKSTSCVVL